MRRRRARDRPDGYVPAPPPRRQDGQRLHRQSRGGSYAYVNRCPHAGAPLDAWPNEFFTEDGRFLICATRGAIFAPETGVCVEGPCPGARLQPMRVERDGTGLVVTWPS